jgi:hypothetical protein
MATPEEHKWLIEMVQSGYQPYNLSFEQTIFPEKFLPREAVGVFLVNQHQSKS